jgi:hypothetical protein
MVMFMVMMLSAPLAPGLIPPTSTQPLVRYHVLAPDQNTAQQLEQFLSTPGSLSIAFPEPTGGSMVARVSYQGAVTVAGISYYGETQRAGQPWTTPPIKYQNKYVVRPVSGTPSEVERYVGSCGDALNRTNTNQWQLTDFAFSRWDANAPGTASSWIAFARGQIASMRNAGWSFKSEGHSYNPVARYNAWSWRFTREVSGTIRTIDVSVTDAGPVRLTETEYVFKPI